MAGYKIKESEYCTEDCNEGAVKASKSTKTSDKKGKDTKEYRDTSSQDQ